MFKALSTVSLALLSLATAQPVEASIEAIGCRGDPCRISFNGGGEVSVFIAAAKEVLQTGRLVVIDGRCYSACAIFADRARANVCITSKAQFGFHKGYQLSLFTGSTPLLLVQRFEPRHSADISRWIRNRGGYPSKGFLTMNAADARRIWRRC